jgi:hypothetical protein
LLGRLNLDAAHNIYKRVRQDLSPICNPPRELNQPGDAIRVSKKECRQLREIGSLFGDIE